MRPALLCVLLLPLFVSAQTDEASYTYLLAGKLFDAEQKQLLTDQIVVVDKGRIIQVGGGITIPDSATVVDLREYTLLPGLIDAHTHLLTLDQLDEGAPITNKILYEGDALRALRGAKRAQSWLEHGFTTVRDLGDSGAFLDVALKRAIREGTAVGPRMLVSGPIIASEGGQAAGLLPGHDHVIGEEYTIVRSVDDAINAVRRHVTYGADLIKICANNTPNNTTLTVAEMEAIVKMAHRYGKKVTAHATDDRAIHEAVTAGVDGIEHGYQVSDSTLALMAEREVVLVPTDISRELFFKYLELEGSQGDFEAIYRGYRDAMADRLRRAISAGVTIVTGSDNYIDFGLPQGEAAKHILLAYLEEGMSPLDILASSTHLSATLMGMEGQLGVIKAGAFADMIAVGGDVEADFATAMFDVRMVMKNGEIVFVESPIDEQSDK